MRRMDDEQRYEADRLVEPRKQPEDHVMLAPSDQGNRLKLYRSWCEKAKKRKTVYRFFSVKCEVEPSEPIKLQPPGSSPSPEVFSES